MKVLLYSPLNPTVPRVYARTLQGIITQDWPFPMEIVFGKHDQTNGQHAYDNLIDKHNQARRMALEGGYDALFLVEADMVIPQNALLRLAAIDTDVAYGLYVSRHGSHQWLAFSSLRDHTGKSIDRDRRYCAQVWGKVIETKGVGMGCTLIRRNVLEKIEFTRRGSCADDWYFSLDCIEAGFTQKHDLGVVCGHILGSNGAGTAWPNIHKQEMVEIEH